MSSLPDHSDDPQQHAKLACKACQRKKIKCDRSFPCGQCQRSNLPCFPSTRKPRARLVGKRAADSSELRSRITKLEGLVETLSGENAPQDHDAVEEDRASGVSGDIASPTVGRYIASPFWATLSNEVQALRDALEEEEASDGEPESPETRPPTDGDHPTHDLIICPPGSIFVIPGALPDPPASTMQQLYELFLHNADPVLKVTHQPSLKRCLETGGDYLGHTASSPPTRALKAAMWFAAITTLSDVACFARFRHSRLDLLQQYRRRVDVALAQADLINTNSLPTLQAFVIYTASCRVTDCSRRAWVNTGLIVRIASGMGLHREVASDTPFIKEIKRRLFHQIRVLDAFAAIDRASELLISLGSFDTPLPGNCNDTEFDEASTFIPARHHGISDMTFSLMAHHATAVTMQLTKPETNASKAEPWQQRLDAALGLGRELREKYLQYCDLSKPFHRFLYAVGGSMSAGSALRAVRPLQRYVSKSKPPRIDSTFVLQLAVNNLRESEATYQDPEAEGWRWMFWVQWHALAITLAGLCSIKDTELSTTAWIYVEKSYERHSRQIADSTSGMLWRPIEKLYKKASAFRDGTSSSGSGISPPNANVSKLSIGGSQDTAVPYVLPHGQTLLPPGGMPTSGFMNCSMDFSVLDDNFDSLPSLQRSDFSWADWENIMTDIQAQTDVEPLDINKVDLMNRNFALGDMQLSNNM